MRLHLSFSKTAFSEIIRDLLFSFLILWLINPQSRFNSLYNWNIYGVILLGWLLFAYLSSPYTFKSLFLDVRNIYIWVWPTYLFFASQFGHAPFAIKQYTISFIFLYFAYYMKAGITRTIKILMIIIAVYIVAVTITTYTANIAYPQLSRILAHGDAAETLPLSNPFIADFSYCYSLTGLAIASLCCLRVNHIRFPINIALVVIYVWIIIVLIITQYVLALFGIALFSIFIFIIVDDENIKKSVKPQKILMFMFGTIFLVAICFELPSILEYLVSVVPGDNNQYRLKSLLSLIQNETTLSGMHRPQLYLLSINTWLKDFSSFLFGVGYFVDDTVIGEHSSLFDTFGRYGIIGGVAWLSTVTAAFRIIFRYINDKASVIMKCVILLLVYQSIVNPMYYDLILTFYFFVIPMFVVLICELVNHNE